jgi:hypothetical protein
MLFSESNLLKLNSIIRKNHFGKYRTVVNSILVPLHNKLFQIPDLISVLLFSKMCINLEK